MILLGQISISLKTFLCLVSMATVRCKTTLKCEFGSVFSRSAFVWVTAHLSGHTTRRSPHHLNLQLCNFLNFLVNILRSKLHVCVPAVSADRRGIKLSIQVQKERLKQQPPRLMGSRCLVSWNEYPHAAAAVDLVYPVSETQRSKQRQSSRYTWAPGVWQVTVLLLHTVVISSTLGHSHVISQACC